MLFRGASGFAFGSLFLGGTLLLATLAHIRWDLIDLLGGFGIVLMQMLVPLGSLVAVVAGVLGMLRFHIWQFAMSVFGVLGGVGALFYWALLMFGS